MAGRTNASALVRVAARARVSRGPSIAVRVGSLAHSDRRSSTRRLARHHTPFYRRGGLELEFVAGVSPEAIVKALNGEGIASPFGGAWGPSTIYGNGKRGTGILNNELYVGRLVWVPIVRARWATTPTIDPVCARLKRRSSADTHTPRRNSSTTSLNRSGASRFTMCPAPSIVARRTLGMSRTSTSAIA